MSAIDFSLAGLRRPRLLVSAARFGLGTYRREAVLPRLLDGSVPLPGRTSLRGLARLESELEAGRKEGRATYSIAAHVECLTALMAEAQLLNATANAVS
ncbi:DUF6477 family protein [Palleronia abyssalis]|uniref:Uncharacterized protein n=1 Tax=Palleronia abyssalis TaxID=1501240 RepID=A0A2R8BQ03_9RHOB|nr:DUF6477 family protein [Palleronia abyssalis]SPJ22254.1 hypothetical protein PAA8504_00042 [Palleronia abyssalis]